uniref:Reverse transcriptase domain-containing protein n=1 Tax=Steinernema glaseri TaxID=37863 RepID=A0A1I7Y6G3_9BILA
MIYAQGSSAVRIDNLLAAFDVQRGVRQGDSLSPLLFITTLQYALHGIDWKDYGIKINGSLISYLAYADDIVLLSRSTAEAQLMVTALCKETEKIGLKINVKKSKWMVQSRPPNPDKELLIHNEPIDLVSSFKYLGQTLAWPRNHTKEISQRISAGWGVYAKYKDFLSSRRVPIEMKKKLVELCVKPAILYGCETWSLTKSAWIRIRSAQRRMERRMLGLRLLDKVPSVDIRS